MNKEAIATCYKEIKDEQDKIVKILEQKGYKAQKRDIDLFCSANSDDKHLANIWFSIPIFAD